MIIEWKFKETSDPQIEDSSTDLIVDGIDTGIAIQHCAFGGGFSVGEIGHDPEWFHIDHGHRSTMKAAQALAQRVLRQRGKVEAI